MPALLFRLRSLDWTPNIRLEREAESLVVFAEHRGHAQVIDLSLHFEAEGGAEYWMRPNGEWIEGTSGEAGLRKRAA